jgi:hypothetical protein
MSHRTAFWLAWSLCAVCVVLIGLALLLDFLTDASGVAGEERGLLPGDADPTLVVITGVLSLGYPMVGALIASRLPTNPIGWIFCGVGLLYAGQRFTIAYADYALYENLAFSGGVYVAWFSGLLAFKGTVLAGVFLMLLFPDGHLLSPRWRIVAWMAVLGAVLRVIYDAFTPEPLETHSYVQNPFGVVEGTGGGVTTYDVLSTATLHSWDSWVAETLLFTSSLAALFSLFVRLHRAQGVERQQLKWFLYAGWPAVAFLAFVWLTLNALYYPYLTFTKKLFPFIPLDVIFTYTYRLDLYALLFVPLLIYIAIVSYRLYDIDVVINRTLVYGSLTAMLVALYFVGIVVLQRVFVLLTGQQSTLAVVASTLLIAALFSPLRRRIQSFIDRRFYRRRYDARKTLEAFSTHLRNETDLEALSGDLVGVVRETMQPAHVSLWLRPETARKGGQTH